MSRTPRLYDLPPEVKKLLRIETFKGNFDATAFMESISADVVKEMKDYQGKDAFDPRPFIRTLENALEELEHLRTRVQEQCDELESSTQMAEHQYKKNIIEMKEAFNDVYRSCEALEGRIGEVGQTAVRIGEQLETIDKQRSRASESRDIIEYFMEFEEGSSERLEMLREGGEEGQIKAAILARRLNAVAKEVDTAVKARAGIERFCEDFEKDMLREFDRAYREGDPHVMAHRARVLFEFNGGASCVQRYVNQHEFFISNRKIEEMEELRRSEDNMNLSNPYIPPPEVDTSLVKLYDDIRITVRKEAGIISAVFPQPATVMQVFLQRIFAQSIQNHVELLLSRAEQCSHLAYLRTLASTHAETKRLVESLKFCCEKEVLLAGGSDMSGLVSAASPEEALDRCMADLFVPYTEGDRYLTREKLAINELFGQIVSEFLTFMQERKKNSARNQSVLTRTLNQISASTTAGVLASSAFSPGSNDSGSQNTNPFESQSNSESARSGSRNLVVVDESGFKMLSRGAIMRMLNIHAEAIVRCLELSEPQELPRSVQFLYDLLTDFMGTKYLDIALDDIIEELASKSEPETTCFPVITATTEIIQLLQKHFQTAVVPLVMGSPSVHRDVLYSKNKFMGALEQKANLVLQKEYDAIISWLSELLSRQKRNDFRPRDEDIAMMGMGTEPCIKCVDLLDRVYRAASRSLQGKNLETYLWKIGSTFHSMLMSHFKKFYVTPTGGLFVSKDIAKYQEVIQQFKIPALNDRFEMLRQVGSIFLVKPEILRSIITEGYLARLDPKMWYPYLEKRVDFKFAKLDRVLGISMEDANGDGNNTNNNKSQRRSLFVDDNAVLKEMRRNYENDREFSALMGKELP